MKDRGTPFESAKKLRAWLQKHHATATELVIQFFKKGSGKKTVTYPEAVEEALCFGWIDGRVQSIDDERYVQRYTPRKKKSYWSAINIAKAKKLIDDGRMTKAGLDAFEARDRKAKGRYSFERRGEAKLDAAGIRRFRANDEAWAFFSSQPPGYRQTAIFLVMSAKREETRARRLEQLIAVSAKHQRLPQLVSPKPRA